MSWSLADMPDQTGRFAVVTGANAGLGFEIAKALSLAGAHVVLACRNEQKANAAADRIRAAGSSARVETMALDLADLASVRAFAAALPSHTDRLDILANNAGLMAVDRSTTVDGFETQFGVNHLGHFALTGLVLPLLLATPRSRVVSMSSMGHRPGNFHASDPNCENRRYSRWGAYFQSKLSNLLFTAELQRRLTATGAGTIAVAAHPGASRTDLGVEGSSVLNKVFGPLGWMYTQSAARGALPFLLAATDPKVEGGSYWGPRFTMWGAPRRETPTRRARNADLAAELWRVSEQSTDVRYLDR